MANRNKIDSENNKICFLISPIGKKGTETYNNFKEILDHIIRPGIKESGYNLNLIRADEIDKSGSFIKQILEHLYKSFIVIADLTNQNPNVFYELGVRHSLSPRIILIAQNSDDIPSDLKEYRTIIYDISPKGITDFKVKLKNYLNEIYRDPEYPDNPVLDRLGDIINEKAKDLQNKIAELEGQIAGMNDSLKKGKKRK